MAQSSSEVFFDLLHKLLFIPRGGIEVGLLYGPFNLFPVSVVSWVDNLNLNSL